MSDSIYREKINKWGLIMINFVTVNEMNKDVIDSLVNIPHDVDLIVGVPRSGMLVASIIAAQLNKPMMDINSYCNNMECSVGKTTNITVKRMSEIKKVLIVEDSVLLGVSINEVKKRIEQAGLETVREHIYYAVYVSRLHKSYIFVDYYARMLDNRIFEWNLMHHPELNHMCFDIDGVLCEDPTREQNDDGEKYLDFLKNARPKYVPTRKIGCLVTSRLEKYRNVTESWLQSQGIEYDKLIMCPLKTIEERQRYWNHAAQKAIVYAQLTGSELFVESEKWEAIEIARRTMKPVFCTENQQLYSPVDFPKDKARYEVLSKIGKVFPKRVRAVFKRKMIITGRINIPNRRD
jgi:orotate phosphoribosyltransferase